MKMMEQAKDRPSIVVGNLLIHGAVDCRLGSTLYSPDVDTVENMMQKGLPRS